MDHNAGHGSGGCSCGHHIAAGSGHYFSRVNGDLRDRIGQIDASRCPLYLLHALDEILARLTLIPSRASCRPPDDPYDRAVVVDILRPVREEDLAPLDDV